MYIPKNQGEWIEYVIALTERANEDGSQEIQLVSLLNEYLEIISGISMNNT